MSSRYLTFVPLAHPSIVLAQRAGTLSSGFLVGIFINDQQTVVSQLRLFAQFFSNLLKHPLPRPRRILHEVLQRLSVGLLHAIAIPA